MEAHVTIKSLKSGEHLSVRLNARANDGQVWVGVAIDRATVIFANRPGKNRAASKIGRYLPRRDSWVWDESATPAEQWTAQAALAHAQGNTPQGSFEVYDAVPCTRCGEMLYDPESIKLGIGPTCNRKATKSKAVRSGAASIPQDELDFEAEIMRAELRANGIDA
jgi:hypothetical protein